MTQNGKRKAMVFGQQFIQNTVATARTMPCVNPTYDRSERVRKCLRLSTVPVPFFCLTSPLLHWMHGPCKTLASFSINFQVSLSLYIILQLLTSIFSSSYNHLFLGFRTKRFPSGRVLTFKSLLVT